MGLSYTMEFQFNHNGQAYTFESTKFHDLSTPIRNGSENVNAYYLEDPKFEPFRAGDFVGSVKQGGACNCEDITFNAHGNGTHTECVGHISDGGQTINGCLKDFTTMALVVSLTPDQMDNGDKLLSKDSLAQYDLNVIDSLIVRTLPNSTDKKTKRYSGTNPTYLSPEFTAALAANNIKHLIVDLPSVDREEDGGLLKAHHAFWQYPDNPRTTSTITELAYIPDEVADGQYLLQIQIAAFESDASPSKPILYPLTEI